MSHIRFVMTMLLGYGLLWIGEAAGQSTYFVDRGIGNDSNSGDSWNAAKATIAAGLGLVTGSDTVCVAEGNYLERIVLATNVTLLGGFPSGGGQRDPAARETTIDGQRQGTVVTTYGNSSALIDGFIITSGRAVQGGGIYGAGDCTFRNLKVIDNQADGMGGGFFCTQNVTIEDCRITNNMAPVAPAIAIIGRLLDYAVVVRRNVIRHNVATSLQMSGGAVNVTSLLRLNFSYNLVADNTAHDGGLYFINTSGEKTLDHNTIARNGEYGLTIENSSDVTLSNSIVYHHSRADVIVEDVFSNPRLRYSDVGTVSGAHLAENLISVDPQFADTAAGAYTLLETSPCIDAGDPEAPRDLDGSITDMGVFPHIQQTTGVVTAYERPSGFAMEPAFPNPFFARTSIAFALDKAGPVRAVVYDVLGREVRRLLDGQLSLGRYVLDWDGRNADGIEVGPGIYHIVLRGGNTRVHSRVVRLK